jgi:hypothetical protein
MKPVPRAAFQGRLPMIRYLIRGLVVFAVAVALLAPAPMALARPADDVAATTAPSVLEVVTGWLANVLHGVFAASSATTAGDGSDTATQSEPDGARLTTGTTTDTCADCGPTIDPNG